MPSKPESPILSRMGFTHTERGSAALRTDASAPSALPSTKPSTNFPPAKWHTEASPRFHAKSPRSSEFDAAARTERVQRPLGSGSTSQLPGKKKPMPLPGHGDWSRSPAADSFSNKSTAAGGRTWNDERPNGEARTPTATQCNGAMANDVSGTQWETEKSVRDIPIPVERIRKFGKSTTPELKSFSTERSGSRDIGKGASGGFVNGNSFPLSEKQNVPSKCRTDAPIAKARVASQKPLQIISRDRAIANVSLADRNPAAALKKEPSSHFSRGFVERKTMLTSEATRKVLSIAKSRKGSQETAAMVSSQTKRYVPPITLGNAGVRIATNDEGISANSKSLPDGTEVPTESKVWEESLQNLSKLLNPRAASPNRTPLRERATPPASTPPPPPKPKTRSIPVLTGTRPPETTVSTGDSRGPPQTLVRALHASRSHAKVGEPAVAQHKTSDVKKGVQTEKMENKPELLKPAPGSPPQEKKPTERHSPLLKAPALPSLNLRSILSSGLTPSSAAVGKPVTSPDPLPDLRSLLRPVTSTTDPKKHPNEADNGASRRGPVSVPASAMSLLRSSPRARAREIGVEGSSKPLSSLSLPHPAVWKYLEPATQLGKGMGESDSLIQAIHGIDKRITEVERKLIPLRTCKSMSSVKVESSLERVPAAITKGEDLGTIFAIAKQLAAGADLRDNFRPRLSTDPSQAALRLIVVHNHAKAAAASAALRPVCSHPDRGLQSIKEDFQTTLPVVSPKVFAAVSCEVRKRNIEADARNRALRREYISLRDSWLRKLKSARDKKSREKREATKERDRFLVLRTKGHSALLTSRTSSGRTSTKLFPSLSANGHFNSNTEVDALLAEIAAAGGTPGSKDIWSKTLAEIPDQNCSFVPCDNGSVLVEDPIADFAASQHVNPWYFKEKLVFLEKFIVYSKNFRKIASFLDHKSTRECSQFYYMNKLDLGLKQLAKESSGMKRKGILRSHIVNLAKKRLCFESDEVVEEQTRAFLSAKSLVISSSFDRGHSSELMDLGGSRGNAHIDKAQLQSMKMMFKKRIMGEYGKFDVSDIDIEKFSRVIAMYGTDWKKVSAEMEVQGKSSTHYREFYRKNRRKLRQGLDSSSYPRLTVLPRCQSPPLRQSPRSSPQASPRSSPSSSHRRLRRNMSAREIDELTLTRAVDLPEHTPSTSTAAHGKGDSTAQNSAHQVRISNIEYRTAKDVNRRRDGETESRKSKTSTWTSEEGEQFRQLFKRYGRDWKRIAHLMSPKTPTQVKGYWKKVAHEVGNGLPSDSTKTKGEKKRPRRSASVDDLPGEETNDLKMSSSEKRSASLKHIGASHSDRDRREAKRQRQNGPSLFLKEVAHSPSEKVCEGKLRTSVASPNLAEHSSRANGTINEYIGRDHPNGTESNEDTDSKKIEGRKTSDMRIPLLRSTPVPVFRSIPAGKLDVEGSGGEKGRRGDVAVLGGARTEGERGSENGPRQAELRRTAESYGVLAHLGARLDDLDSSHGQKGKKQS